MSRSLYGARDRRIPEKAVPNTAVHDEYEKLYRSCNPAVMPKNRPVLETQANQAAIRSLSEEDRARIEVMRIQLKERCGMNFGEDAATDMERGISCDRKHPIHRVRTEVDSCHRSIARRARMVRNKTIRDNHIGRGLRHV